MMIKDARGFYFSDDMARAFGPEAWFGLPLFENVGSQFRQVAIAANSGAAVLWLKDGRVDREEIMIIENSPERKIPLTP